MSIQALQQLRDSDKVLMQRTAALELEVAELKRRLDSMTRPVLTAKPQEQRKQ